jgi:GNAT superfamily N-acetyltransferase
VPDVLLSPFTGDDARAVLDGRRSMAWADGYPTAGDVEMATSICDGSRQAVDVEFPWGPWVVSHAGRVVGGVGFHGPPDQVGSVEIGYGVAAEFWGQGVATRAVLAMLAVARENGAVRLVAGTDAANIASQRVLQKAGFTRTEDDDEGTRWVLELKGPQA